MFRVRFKEKVCQCGHPNYSHTAGLNSCAECECGKFRGKNKYKAKKAEFNGNIYHSKREAQKAAEFHYQMLAGDLKAVERQVRIPLNVNGYHICNYIIDFLVTHNDDSKEYVEVKGFETAEWRLKWKVFEALYGKEPNVRLTIIR